MAEGDRINPLLNEGYTDAVVADSETGTNGYRLAARLVSVDFPDEYETVAANASDQPLGANGAVGDYLNGLLIVPATTSPGAVSVKDGGGSSIVLFTGGASSVSNLVPFFVPVNAKAVNDSSPPGWTVTTGDNVSVFASGEFT